MDKNKEEGWTWLQNSKKWHYFRNKKSLCGKWSLFIHPNEGYELGNNDSSDNCTTCRKKLEKEGQNK